MRPPGGSAPDDDPGGSDVDSRLESLLDEYGSFLRAAIRRVSPWRLGISTEDVEQDARIRLWNALRGERTITDPASYLYRVGATAALDAVRRVRARREQPIDPAGAESPADIHPASRSSSPEVLASSGELASQLRDALASMPVNRRRAVGLHLRGFSSTEIARLLGWTEPKARNLTHRGLRDLRDLLRARGIDPPETA